MKSWKQKILEEERKLKLEIKKALKVKDLNISESEISHQGWWTFLKNTVLETALKTAKRKNLLKFTSKHFACNSKSR